MCFHHLERISTRKLFMSQFLNGPLLFSVDFSQAVSTGRRLLDMRPNDPSSRMAVQKLYGQHVREDMRQKVQMQEDREHVERAMSEAAVEEAQQLLLQPQVDSAQHQQHQQLLAQSLQQQQLTQQRGQQVQPVWGSNHPAQKHEPQQRLQTAEAAAAVAAAAAAEARATSAARRSHRAAEDVPSAGTLKIPAVAAAARTPGRDRSVTVAPRGRKRRSGGSAPGTLSRPGSARRGRGQAAVSGEEGYIGLEAAVAAEVARHRVNPQVRRREGGKARLTHQRQVCGMTLAKLA